MVIKSVRMQFQRIDLVFKRFYSGISGMKGYLHNRLDEVAVDANLLDREAAKWWKGNIKNFTEYSDIRRLVFISKARFNC